MKNFSQYLEMVQNKSTQNDNSEELKGKKHLTFAELHPHAGYEDAVELAKNYEKNSGYNIAVTIKRNQESNLQETFESIEDMFPGADRKSDNNADEAKTMKKKEQEEKNQPYFLFNSQKFLRQLKIFTENRKMKKMEFTAQDRWIIFTKV